MTINDIERDPAVVEEQPITDEVTDEQVDTAPVEQAETVDASGVQEQEPDIRLLPVLPLRGTVVFPLSVVPLAAAQPRSIRLIDEVMSGDRVVAMVMQKDAEIEGAGPDDCYTVGTITTIHTMMRVPDGSVRLAVQGTERMKILEWISEEPFLMARVQVWPEPFDETVEVQALSRNTLDLFQRLVSIVSHLPDELVTAALNVDDPRHLVYLVATNLRMDPEEKQALLELESVKEKLERLNAFIAKELDVLELGKKLQSEVQEEMSKSQREYYLREQLKAIQRELGETNETEAEVNELRTKIDEAGMPEEAEREAKRELDRLSKLPPAAAEYGVIKTYLDWLTSMPWNKSTENEIDIQKTREILEAEHYGLDKIKERILEYLAVRKLKQQQAEERGETPVNREPILLLVGPPGVGKTSLAQSIAKSLGRELTRMSLGGVRDEAEIRGHRRTYVGAMPGRIVQAIRRAGSNDPVFVLDEVDKLGNDWRGDPSSALLEVLDPEQNNSFRDHYLDVAFDLSKVMFIATANLLDTIPAPLRDRMEILELSGYTDEDKLNIARKYLVPKQLKANGLLFEPKVDDSVDGETAPQRDRTEILKLTDYTEEEKLNLARKYRTPEQLMDNDLPSEPKAHESADGESAEQAEATPAFEFTDAALLQMIRHYTREAGVRNLEREIGTVCRKVATRVAEGREVPASIDVDQVREFLGRPRFFYEEAAARTAQPGVSIGVGVSSVGGDIMFIEATRMPGKGAWTVTGQLGDVMKESAQAALSLVRSRAKDFAIDPDFLQHSDIHIHVPAGAIPKDGPSAGVAITTALVSLLSGIPVRDDVAMTGEITLRGQVMPVGGIKEKSLAARRAGLTTFILPKRNEVDLDDLPQELKDEMTFVTATTIDEALAVSMPEEFHRRRAEFANSPVASVGSSQQGIVAAQG
jgi:ATP-dependent Lon protease